VHLTTTYSTAFICKIDLNVKISVIFRNEQVDILTVTAIKYKQCALYNNNNGAFHRYTRNGKSKNNTGCNRTTTLCLKKNGPQKQDDITSSKQAHYE